MRLRQLTQDDGHIFCAEDQVASEVERFCRELSGFYRRFGFDNIALALSLRPDNRLGDDAWWDLAPEQISVVPVAEAHRDHAARVCTALAAAGLRSRVDDGDRTLSRRIAQAHHDGVPFVVVLGDRERADNSLSIRARDRQWTAPVDAAVYALAAECEIPEDR
jgi:threonyl-tRNA synthetase